MGGQEAAIAGSQAIVFTATDRKVIEERGGKIDKNRSFIDVLKDRPMTPEVENEETNVRPQMDLSEFKGRVKEHKRMLRHSNLYNPRERVEINNELPDNYEESSPPPSQPVSVVEAKVEADPEVKKEGVKVVTKVVPEVKAEDHSQLETYDEMNQKQTDHNSLKSRVKQYHLLRLLSDNEQEFKRLSDKIRMESLSGIKPAGRKWLDAQLTRITLGAAKYKLGLLNSLEEMHLDDQHKKAIQWLTRLVNDLDKK